MARKNKFPFLVNTKRVVRAGWRSFWRNSWLSAATILVMVLTIFMMTGLVFFNVLTQEVLTELKDKVDISVYFEKDASEEEMLSLRDDLVIMQEVKTVEYVSEEEALNRFKERHKDDPALLESLKELEENPLQASLNIKSDSAADYELVAQFLERPNFQNIIEKVNFTENKAVIDKLSAIADTIQKAGLLISLVLAFLAVLVTFNTIRLTIYTWREEISVKRLVGATNWNIRGPFVMEGVFYGVAAGLSTMVITIPVVAILSPKIVALLPGGNLFAFLKTNLFSILLFQVMIGVVLGAFSSLIAMRRYLK